MKITVLTLFPAMITPFFSESILKRAQEKKSVEIEIVNLRDFAVDSYGTVDDRPYGGGAGMVLRADVVVNALKSLHPPSANGGDPLPEGGTDKDLPFEGSLPAGKAGTPKGGGMLFTKIILTSAKGIVYNQQKAEEYSQLEHLIIIAGHYEGVDERLMTHVDEEVSVGDFVLTGGEIPAVLIADSVVRLVPGVLKKDEATQEESFCKVPLAELIEVIGKTDILSKLEERGVSEVRLLEYPHYTRPEIFEKQSVPEILLSGNHAKIREWRLHHAYQETVKKRPDLLEKNSSNW